MAKEKDMTACENDVTVYEQAAQVIRDKWFNSIWIRSNSSSIRTVKKESAVSSNLYQQLFQVRLVLALVLPSVFTL